MIIGNHSHHHPWLFCDFSLFGISAPLEESSAYCVWGVFHCEEQKAVPRWLQQEEIHELTWQDVGEVGRFRHSFFHQLRANVEDWGFFPSFPFASLSSYIWNLVWVQTTFSLLGSGKKFPSVLPTKIHRSHRYFPRPWKIRAGREGYCQNLRQNKYIPDSPLDILWDLSQNKPLRAHSWRAPDMSKIIKITIFAETRKKLGNRIIHSKHCWDVFAHARRCAPERKPARHSGRSAIYTQTLVGFLLIDSNQYFSTAKKITGILKGNNSDSQEEKCLWVTLRNSPSGHWDSENSRVAQPWGTVLGLLPELESWGM